MWLESRPSNTDTAKNTHCMSGRSVRLIYCCSQLRIWVFTCYRFAESESGAISNKNFSFLLPVAAECNWIRWPYFCGLVPHCFAFQFWNFPSLHERWMASISSHFSTHWNASNDLFSLDNEPYRDERRAQDLSIIGPRNRIKLSRR